ncbi:hypothetical protein OIU84_013937 [Salix udensis]|uniref:Uncharacterized protein n=1 Tax=Salix udensis TaxID=889485 RepID=A0AAD6JAT8_9ROSI|nr:hypothetical protein OIU84_013937 [Salix udensis]
MSSPPPPPTSTTATTANNNYNASCSSSSTVLSRKCFNSDCTDVKSRKGWRLRSGDFAELCDRCASAYEEGSFCEAFHSRASGWRCCESCGKRVHCGCIVSIQAFTLLDAGGIACLACARKSFVLTSNPAWSPLFYHASFPERLKDLSVKSWSQLAGSGPVPWRQAPSLFNPSATPAMQSELQTRMPYEVDRLNTGETFSAPSLEKRKVEDFSEKFINGNLRIRLRDIVENGNAGIIGEEQSQTPSSLMEDASAQQFGISLPYKSLSESNSQIEGSVNALQPAPPPPFTKHFHGSLHNGVDSSVDGHIRNGKPRTDARGRSQLLPRYWPRFTDGELHQISGNSNSVIKPLFEKMLSASDAGRIGRLVLPKKCAEAYFPPISQPEGLPLRVQDSTGKEWIFQFRFWPNNNSRMYVLEGVTPCIQNMQLQAGDTVTFSRLEPEGKLVMGFRKATSATPSDQDNETSQIGNGVFTKGDAELDHSPWSKVDKSGYIAKEVLEGKSSIRKRKSSTLGSKRFEFEEYEDAPVLGKPTIFATDNVGQKVQWVQCEDCLKWRKLPANTLLPSKWACSSNTWDPERSSCSVAQELTAEQLEYLIPSSVVASKRSKDARKEIDRVEALEGEGLDTLANLAILGEVKRRFKTLMMKREKKQSEKEAETKQSEKEAETSNQRRSRRSLLLRNCLTMNPRPLATQGSESGSPNKKKTVSEGSDDDPKRMKSSTSPFKGQIDLNIQPEREDELSPGSDSGGGMVRMLQDATETYLRMQRFLSSDGDNNPSGNQMLSSGGTGEKTSDATMRGSSHQDADKDHPSAFFHERIRSSYLIDKYALNRS